MPDTRTKRPNPGAVRPAVLTQITAALRRPYGSYPERIHNALATVNHAISALPGHRQTEAREALLALLNWMDDGGAK